MGHKKILSQQNTSRPLVQRAGQGIIFQIYFSRFLMDFDNSFHLFTIINYVAIISKKTKKN